MKDQQPTDPTFYRVITDSFILDDKVYTYGELIERQGRNLDYCLGHHLLELYKPSESPSASRPLGKLRSLLSLRA